MMRRTCLAGLLLIVVAGCGGVKPVSFSDKTRPLASQLKIAIDNQDLETIDRTLDIAQQRLERKLILSTEFAVLESCQKSAKEGKWEDARVLITDSLARQR